MAWWSSAHNRGQHDRSDGKGLRESSADYERGYYSTKAQQDFAKGSYSPPSRQLHDPAVRETYNDTWEGEKNK